MSRIDGTLCSEIDGADLYLLNPAGVMFGQNASLELSGSFRVSTGDYLRMAGLHSTDIFSAGPSGVILHYDGSAWTERHSGTEVPLYGLWGGGPPRPCSQPAHPAHSSVTTGRQGHSETSARGMTPLSSEGCGQLGRKCPYSRLRGHHPRP